MALRKLTQIKGYDYSYWKITGLTYDVEGDTVININLFKDQATSDYIIDSVMQKTFIIRWGKDIYSGENVLQTAYEHIKLQPEFDGAENV